MTTKKAFLGIGVNFPVGPTVASQADEDGQAQLRSRGAIAPAEYEESVRQSVWIILGTAKGERVMRPDFGCGIYDFVFESTTPATIGKISLAVRNDLLRFEPRIEVLDVSVTPQPDPELGQKLLISVDYRVRTTDNIFNLVYPFYLERSAG